MSADDVEALFRTILRRPVNNEAWKASVVERGGSIVSLISQLRKSEELKAKVVAEAGAVLPSTQRIDDYQFRLPQQLSQSSLPVKKVLLIGSCLLNSWQQVIESQYSGLKIERITFNNASALPEKAEEQVAEYDFQLLQMPLRSVLREAAFFSIRADDDAAYEKLLDHCFVMLRKNYDALLEYNTKFGIETYMVGFYTPIQNPLGRAQPRYKLSNLGYFIEKLNAYLYELTEQTPNAHFIDLDDIVSTYGKKYFQDDFLTHSNHGSVAADVRMKADRARLEPTGSVDELYTPNIGKFIIAIFEEVLAAYKTARQTDSIKLVIFDLDDTLWRGVAAELDDPDPALIEGWPLGIIEAASVLWRRGILIAIASKNDEENVRAIWGKVVGNKFSLDNFISLKINWNSKADNIGEIIQEANLLSSSVLFVDDNPLERAAVKQKYPEIRVMDAPLVEWRRILLWSPELQRSVITKEAVDRGTTIKAQIVREETRKSMGHEEFLHSLGVKITPTVLTSTADQKFERCFELLNKTNQFNTTGRRWSSTEINGFLGDGGFLLALNVDDMYTNYGMTGLLLVSGRTVVQFVLSCRVFGMGVENAAIAIVSKLIDGPMEGLIQPTAKNQLSQVLFKNLNFTEQSDGVWIAPEEPLVVPSHVAVNEDGLKLELSRNVLQNVS